MIFINPRYYLIIKIRKWAQKMYEDWIAMEGEMHVHV